MVKLIRSDIEFIYQQILIAEAESGGASLLSLLGNNPALPFGLRHVDGSSNNLVPGQSGFGAADNLFPRLTDPVFRAAEDNPNIPGITPTSYAQTSGTVYDSQPRVISNLTVDVSSNNPAAVAAALRNAGVEGAAFNQAVINITAANSLANTARTAAQDAQAVENSANHTENLANAAQAAAQALLAALNADGNIDVSDGALAEAALTAAQRAQTAAASTLVSATTFNVGVAEATAAQAAAAAALLVVQAARNAVVNDADGQVDQAVLAAAAAAITATGGTVTAAGLTVPVATTSSAAADAAAAIPAQALTTLLAGLGIQQHADGSLVIPNLTTDGGASPPFNQWMTFFGQFFDHGLDLVNKGGNGSVRILLKEDDPLYNKGLDGIAGTTDDLGADGVQGTFDDPVANFMTLTRATMAIDPVTGQRIHENTNQTTPFVDQNQTYSSHPAHQVFLREYEAGPNGVPQATGKLVEGTTGPDGRIGTADDVKFGMATWADVKVNALKLGIILNDTTDLLDIPLVKVDPYGNFIPNAQGLAQLVTNLGADGKYGTADDVVISGTIGVGGVVIPITTAGALRIGHAFLNDIAHAAAPRNAFGQVLTADGDNDFGITGVIPNPAFDPTLPPGPGNIKFLAPNPVNPAGPMIDASQIYDNELLGAHLIAGDGRANENIALLTVHHVFHFEHNRMVGEVKATIIAEAQAGGVDGVTFLNQWLQTPVMAVVPGDLATLDWNGERLFQLAKFSTEMQYQHLVFEEFGRRVQFNIDIFDAVDLTIDPSIVAEFAHAVYRLGHSMLNETVDRFTLNADGTAGVPVTPEQMGLIEAFLNPLAYLARGTNAPGEILHGQVLAAGQEIDEFITGALRDNLLGLPLDLGVLNIARGRDTGVPSLQEVRRQFFEQTGGNTALKPYESWDDFGRNIKHPESLVNFIAAYGTHNSIKAATTLEAKRAAAFNLVVEGTDLLDAGVANTNLDAIAFMNAGGAYLGGTLGGLNDVDLWIGGLAERQIPFSTGLLGTTFNFVFEVQMENLQDGDRFYYLSRLLGTNFISEIEANSFSQLAMSATGTKHLPFNIFDTPTYVIEAGDRTTWTGLDAPVVQQADGTIRYLGVEHIVLGGTPGNDKLRASEGDDTVWGDEGDDTIEGGFGADALLGGDGNDVITDSGGDNVIKGGAGNDHITSAGTGADLFFGNEGDDFINGGSDIDEFFAGTGDDVVILGGDTDEGRGNGGNDWLDGGDSGDMLVGDDDQNIIGTALSLSDDGDDVFVGGGGTDRMEGNGGHDIFFGGDGADRHLGDQGFDWMTYSNLSTGVVADLTIRADQNPFPGAPDALMDRFVDVEGLSGSQGSDILRGENLAPTGLDALTNPALINGLQSLLGAGVTTFSAGNIILGGGGSDIIEGRGGNDIIDGDAYLTASYTWSAANGTTITRSIEFDPTPGDTDTAVFSDVAANYLVGNPDADGWRIVSHVVNGVVGADGVDRIRNIEQLQFSDGTQALGPVTNRGPTGLPQLSSLAPVENQELTVALGNVADADNVTAANPTGAILTPVSFVWQAEQTPGAGDFVDIEDPFTGLPVTGTTFTPTDNGHEAFVGIALMVRGTYVDANGKIEEVFSAVTAPVVNVNDAPTGQPTISDTSPTEGTAITAATNLIVDADGLEAAAFTFQWQVGAIGGGGPFTAIAGATAIAFTPTQAEVNRQLQVVVTYVDDRGTPETVTSTPTVVVGDLVTSNAPRTSGTAGDDVITGGTVANTLNGLAGNDILNGLGGSDTLNGGDGNDTLNGGAGNDVMNGGTGDDVFIVSNGAEIVNEAAGEGTDTVRSTASFSLAAAARANIENVTLLGAGNTNATGNDLANALTGNTGNNDLLGGIGNDTLDGLDGNDLLNGGTGADIMVGGLGNDTYIVDNAGDQVLELAGLNTGTDSVRTSLTTYTLAANVENLSALAGTGGSTWTGNDLGNSITGTGNNDILNGLAGVDILNGGGGADTLNGGTDNDVLNGGAAADVLNGGAGDDALDGGAAADALNGGEGNDVLDGGAGTDTLNGDLGNDTFVFATAAETGNNATRDIVTRFDGAGIAVGDIIDLIGIDADTVIADGVNQAFTFGGASFTAAGQIIVIQSGADTLVRGNTDAVLGNAEFEIRLVGVTAANLTADDFRL